MIASMEDGIRTTDDELHEARHLIADGRAALALPILARLAAFKPDDQEIFEAWLIAHLDLGRHQKVIEIVDAAIARGGRRAMLEFWKSVAYDYQNETERAEACARAALAAEPAYPAAIELLIGLLEKQDRHAEALELCQRACAEDDDNPELAERAIELAARMQLPDSVVDSARAYLKRFGKSAAVLALLGQAYMDRQEYRKADRAFRDAAALEPHVTDHHFNVVMLAIWLGDEAAAGSYLAKLAKRDEEMADAVEAAVDEVLAEMDEKDQNE
jgi:tetratricopeptide (TPR) repeat protein